MPSLDTLGTDASDELGTGVVPIGTPWSESHFRSLLSPLSWTAGDRAAMRAEEERRLNERIFDLYLACYTLDEIAEATGTAKNTAKDRLEALCTESFCGTKSYKLSQFELETNAKGEEQADEHGMRAVKCLPW